MRKRILSIFLIVCLLLSGCQSAGSGLSDSTQSFEEFTEEIFRSYAASDSLTLNYTLASPEKYGISELPDGFPSFSPSDLAQDQSATENTLARLKQYNRDDMSFTNQLLYDVLACSLENDKNRETYQRYAPCFDPSSGIQAQLPVLLSEFYLEDRSDLEQYFALIQSLPGYFSSLLALEETKTVSGTLPCRSTIEHSLSQCQEFLNSSGVTSIQKSFENRVADLDFLASDEKKALTARHKEALNTYLLPAYQALIKGLQGLLSKAPSDGSLAAYPEGKAYYACLLQQKTGTTMSLDELEKTLKQTLTASEQELFTVAAEDPSAFSSCDNYIVQYTDPKHTLKTLQNKITADFPAIRQQSCRICYVDPSLEDYLSPAFYLTPPIDEQTTNIIYINGADKYKHSGLFNTLAHEAYPGHLYQNCYMRQKKMPSLRYMLDFPGYTEGYATYVEIYSYRYLGASDAETRILQNNAISTHCLYALCDLGIHYRHWNLEQLRTFLQSHGIYADNSAETIYDIIIDSPGCYLPYTVGYLEIIKLKEAFSQAAGSSYSDLRFHQFLLDMGPASYSILNRYISPWLAQNGCQD